MRIITLLLLISFSLYAQDFKGVEYQINKAIKSKVFPGASIIIGNKDKVLYHKAFGKFTYEADAPEVTVNTMFDLASVTKVMATTQCVMYLYDKGKLDVNKPVAYYLPDFARNGKDSVTVKHLLMHVSGLPSYYSPKEGESRDDVLDKINSLKLVYKTGSKMVYSCLNLITAMRVVEEITGELMADFYKEKFTNPLGLEHTMFAPDKGLKEQCMPTEGGLTCVVHDPLAQGLEGYSGNAGLFSTTGDLSKFFTMILNDGKLDGRRYYKQKTIEYFTKIHDSSISRGLGWDINQHGDKSCGAMFSTKSFGHNGYTGTCVWVDPERDLYVAFLTNRVYPDDKASIGAVRLAVHNAIIMALDNIPPQPVINSVKLNDKRLTVNWDPRMELGIVEKSIITVFSGDKLVTQKEVGANNTSAEIEVSPEDEYRVFIENLAIQNASFQSANFIVRGNGTDVLLVNGIDSNPSNEKQYFYSTKRIAEAIDSDKSIRTVNNDYLISNPDYINKFKYVIWSVGEDNSPEETLTRAEQKIIYKYLENEGNLLLSGSEIGWALGKPGRDEEDVKFFSLILKLRFEGDNSVSSELTGMENSVMKGFTAKYGTINSLYKVGYPDYFSARKGAEVLLKYNNKYAAAVYKNGAVDRKGRVVSLGFPLATIESEENLKQFMCRMFRLFDR